MSSDGGVEYDADTFLDEAVLESTVGMPKLGEELKEASGLTLTEEASASAATVVARPGDGLLACLRVS